MNKSDTNNNVLQSGRPKSSLSFYELRSTDLYFLMQIYMSRKCR
jgi:hypothetical protein